jgi:putative transposase
MFCFLQPSRARAGTHRRCRSVDERLRSALEILSVRAHAYVLMSNHFHLLIETPKANLSEFMRQLNISYTGYYNRRHRRMDICIRDDSKPLRWTRQLLLELSRYVHLNPVRIKPKV